MNEAQPKPKSNEAVILSAASRWFGRMRSKEIPDASARRASTSALRRASTCVEAMLVPHAIEFVGSMVSTKGSVEGASVFLPRPFPIDRLFEIAAVLSHVDTDVRTRFSGARAFGSFLSGGDKAGRPRLDLARFNRLVRSGDDDIIGRYRRLIDVLDGVVPVGPLVSTLIWHGTDRTRRELVVGYHDLAWGPRESKTDASGAA